LIAAAIGDIVEARTEDVHVKEIRRKLGDAGAALQTVRGVGYRLRGVAPDAAGQEPGGA
jgi:DNA-binding response OmpR family regulator